MSNAINKLWWELILDHNFKMKPHSFIPRLHLGNLKSTGMGTLIQTWIKHAEQGINRDVLISLRVHVYSHMFLHQQRNLIQKVVCMEVISPL